MKQIINTFLIMPCIILLLPYCLGKRADDELISRIQTLPSFNIISLDSIEVFNTGKITKGKPTILLYFDPECHLCQEEIDMITNSYEDFNKCNILMISLSEIKKLKRFVQHYNLSTYAGIKVFKDYKFSAINIFKLKSIPSTILYDNNNEIVKVFEYAPQKKELIEYISIINSSKQ